MLNEVKPAHNLCLTPYRFDTQEVLTPALVLYPQLVRQNIAQVLRVLGGDARRWRPHLKTVKIAEMMALLTDAGINSAKCATTLELLGACQAGFRDVLVAFPHAGANAKRVAQIAVQHANVRISTLVESAEQVASWQGSPVSVFLDINPGMNRTGVEEGRTQAIVTCCRQMVAGGVEFRGLHYYDGHATEADLTERTEAAHRRYGGLLALVSALEASGIKVPELITTGTPALPCALSFGGFGQTSFSHQVSPGTVVYNDLSSLRQLPEEYGLVPAALVVSRVVSHPRRGVITCDAGHKSLSVDSGVPNCSVLGSPEWRPGKPSEEHLPIEIPSGVEPPPLGSVLYLVPRHVCPTVNSANYAALVENGRVASMVRVSARGHEGPLLPLHGQSNAAACTLSA